MNYDFQHLPYKPLEIPRDKELLDAVSSGKAKQLYKAAKSSEKAFLLAARAVWLFLEMALPKKTLNLGIFLKKKRLQAFRTQLEQDLKLFYACLETTRSSIEYIAQSDPYIFYSGPHDISFDPNNIPADPFTRTSTRNHLVGDQAPAVIKNDDVSSDDVFSLTIKPKGSRVGYLFNPRERPEKINPPPGWTTADKIYLPIPSSDVKAAVARGGNRWEKGWCIRACWR